MTLLIHEGKKAGYLFLKDSTVPDPISTDNSEFNIVIAIIKPQLEVGEMDKWNKISNTCMGVPKKTMAGVHPLYTMEKTGTGHQK